MSLHGKTTPKMELFRTDQYYIFINGEYGLWWDRTTGEFKAKSAWDLASADDPECLGVLYGIVGKIELQSVLDSRLMLIKESASVGDLPGGKTVYKIKSIVFLQLGPAGDSVDLGLKPCRKHQNNKRTGSSGSGIFDIHQKASFAKTWGTIKSATNTIKNTTQQAAALATSQVKLGKRRDSKDREKFERRILDELQRVFTETDSFYYCLDGDITNSLQRLCDLKEKNKELNNKGLWRFVDDRFFWNKHMLQDIISLNSPLADPWIVPIIQGFVQIEHCKVEIGFDPAVNEALEPRYETFTLSLISRRSRFRAGTRYKRRGVDEDGKCANYVETEQIVSHHHHQVSFVQVRGSVPVFWSQPGYKYRPPPRIDKGEAETQVAFEKHFKEELAVYGPICIVNLVDQAGKEKIIWDAYTNHILAYNSLDVTYATFDFHEYCRGMHFENVSVLIASLVDIIRDMNYCWTDREGRICSQKGVFRVNCIDCLDRTNVVQTALAKAVMEIQFSKLGLIPPEGTIPSNIRNTFQLLWANNGDIISKQYAGTNALKGDYTRTGERKFTGMMKDGMNSANRYYLSRFKDAYRQATIDMMLGNPVSEDMFSQEKTEDEVDSAATAEHVKLLIEDCKKMLISDTEVILGAWGLIDADPVSGDPTETEMDTILILTRDSYYVAEYDDQVDRVTKYQHVLLDDLTLIEFGVPEQSGPGSLFKQSSKVGHHCIRLHYKVASMHGYYHMFRSTNLRFFNNMAVGIKTDEEMIESLKAICEAFTVALEIAHLPEIPFRQGKLDKRKSKVLSSANSSSLLGSGSYLDVMTLPHMTRNVSESQLLSLKNVGTKALNNVTQQFNKLNKLGHSFNTRRPKHVADSTDKKQGPMFTLGVPDNVPQDTSSSLATSKHSSDDDEDVVSYDYVQDHRTSLLDQQDMPVYPLGMPLRTEVKSHDLFLPGVGIVMSTKVSETDTHRTLDPILRFQPSAAPLIDNVSLSRVVQNVSIRGHVLTHSRTDLSLDVSSLAPYLSRNSSLTPSPHKGGSTTPEITVESATSTQEERSVSLGASKTNQKPLESTSRQGQAEKRPNELKSVLSSVKLTPPNTLQLARKLSHSSDEVDKRQGDKAKETKDDKIKGDHVVECESQRSASVRDLSLNITSSQSESAIKTFRSGITNVITSPAAATKDLVLSPFSKFAKGMQNLGANLDPRKLKTGGMTNIGRQVGHVVTEHQMEEHRKLQEKWKNCRTRLIAL
ncbi:phosphatidylinositide phosphatase SAC2 isoform X2 [Periplaneta americana]|uniref:phosphatidylinositide phosphatase SAC2 isoform X2 n=1 Tax=Periplaneta americana TaxID=6978 RepID=UPI0037E76E7E